VVRIAEENARPAADASSEAAVLDTDEEAMAAEPGTGDEPADISEPDTPDEESYN